MPEAPTRPTPHLQAMFLAHSVETKPDGTLIIRRIEPRLAVALPHTLAGVIMFAALEEFEHRRGFRLSWEHYQPAKGLVLKSRLEPHWIDPKPSTSTLDLRWPIPPLPFTEYGTYFIALHSQLPAQADSAFSYRHGTVKIEVVAPPMSNPPA